MPNIICHTLFMDDVYETLDDSLKEWMSNRKQLLEIGSNGPDFLFFHGYNFKRILKKTELRRLGSTVHREKINDFYIKAIECIENEKNEEIKYDMIAYVCGHLCHWALDSIAHPYVFHRTGDCKGVSAWWHHRFESILDAVMLKAKRNCTIEDYKAGEICDASLEIARAIARIYVPIAKDVYGVDVKPYQIVDCLKDWHFMQTVFYDPSGKKDNVVRSIEKIVGSENLLSGYIVPNTSDDPYDVCNVLHTEWCHPYDNEIVSCESFFDLYDKAMIRAKDVICLFLNAIHNEQGKIDLVHFIGNKTYNAGVPEQKEMLYFNLIW